MTNGKLQDVLIEDYLAGFIVWANPGSKEIICAISGIAKCVEEYPTKYIVYLDPRYDIEWIRQEIIAQIKIAQLEE